MINECGAAASAKLSSYKSYLSYKSHGTYRTNRTYRTSQNRSFIIFSIHPILPREHILENLGNLRLGFGEFLHLLLDHLVVRPLLGILG